MDPTPNSCPFCRSPHVSPFECDVGAWAVSCPSCGAIGPAAPSTAEAIRRWNAAPVGRGASPDSSARVFTGGR